MKRDFVFVWGPDVQPAIAALSAPKIAQLRACCDRLIARAEHYRQNPALLVTIVEMPHLTEEDLPWAPFEKFGYWFRLDYQEKDAREYVLNFAAPPETMARRGSSAAGPGAARPARARRPPRSTDERIALASCRAREFSRCAAALYGALSPAPGVGDGMRAGAQTAARVLDGLLRQAASALRQASVATPAEYAGDGPEARLEPRLLGESTGLRMLLYTLVWDDERVDWSADLFGAPVQGK